MATTALSNPHGASTSTTINGIQNTDLSVSHPSRRPRTIGVTDAITREEIFRKNWQQTQQFLRWGGTLGKPLPTEKRVSVVSASKHTENSVDETSDSEGGSVVSSGGKSSSSSNATPTHTSQVTDQDPTESSTNDSSGNLMTHILLPDQVDPVLYYLEHMITILVEEMNTLATTSNKDDSRVANLSHCVETKEENNEDEDCVTVPPQSAVPTSWSKVGIWVSSNNSIPRPGNLNLPTPSVSSDGERSPLVTIRGSNMPTTSSSNVLQNPPPILAYALQEHIFSKLLHWCLYGASGDVLERVKLAWLQSFELILALPQVELLSHQEVLCPLLHLVHVCGLRSSVQVERHLISLLHRLCLLMTQPAANLPLGGAPLKTGLGVCSNNTAVRLRHGAGTSFRQWIPPLFHQVWHLSSQPGGLLSLYLVSIGESSGAADPSGLLADEAGVTNSSWKRRSWQKHQSRLLFGPLSPFASGAAMEQSATQTPLHCGFLPLNLLIPFMHREGDIGGQARSALLILMTLTTIDTQFAACVAENSDFAPVLATGLSALYSLLPRKLPSSTNADDWQELTNSDLDKLPDLALFLTSLEFCNAVLKMSHPLIKRLVCHLIHSGFLIPVMGSALHQTSLDEVVTATAYLQLFLRRITEPQLLRLFLRFLLLDRHDEYGVLDSLITRINSNTRLGLVTLSLFNTIFDFHCEDVLVHLVFRYLIPCRHLVHSQIESLILQDNNVNYATFSDKFMSLATATGVVMGSSGSSANTTGNSQTHGVPSLEEQYRFYLQDACGRIQASHQASRSWHFAYDGRDPGPDFVERISALNATRTGMYPPHLASPDTGYCDHDSLSEFDSVSVKGSGGAAGATASGKGLARTPSGVSGYGSHNAGPGLRKHVAYQPPPGGRNIFSRYQEQQRLDQHPSADDLGEEEEEELGEFDNISVDSLDHSGGGNLFSTLESEATDVAASLAGSDDTMTEYELPESLRPPVLPSQNDDNHNGPPNNTKGTTNMFTSMYTFSFFDTDDIGTEAGSDLASVVGGMIPTGLQPPLPYQLSELLWGADSSLEDFLQGLDASSQHPLFNLMSAATQKDTEIDDPLMGFDRLLDALVPSMSHTLHQRFPRWTSVDSPVVQLRSGNKTTGTGLVRRESMLTEVDGGDGGDRHPRGTETSTSMSAHEGTNDRGAGLEMPVMTSGPWSTTRGVGGAAAGRSASTAVEAKTAVTSPTLGPFLTVLLCKLESFPGNSVYVNLLLTEIISKLAAYPHPLLRSFLLNTNLVMQPTLKSVYQIVSSVRHRIDTFAQRWDTDAVSDGSVRSAPGSTTTGPAKRMSVTSNSSSSISARNLGTFGELAGKAEQYLWLRVGFDLPPLGSSVRGDKTAYMLELGGSLTSDSSNYTSATAASTTAGILPRRSLFSLFARKNPPPPAPSAVQLPPSQQPSSPSREKPRSSWSSFLTGSSSSSGNGNHGTASDSTSAQVERLEAIRIRNMVYAHVVLREFCVEMSALCREHSVRP